MHMLIFLKIPFSWFLMGFHPYMDNKHKIALIPNLVFGSAASACIPFPREYLVLTSKGNLDIIVLNIECDKYILFNHLILVTN